MGGSKDQARIQVQAITAMDPLEGRLAHAALLAGEKKLDQAQAEYLQILAAPPKTIEPCFEAAGFFLEHDDLSHLDQAAECASRIDPADARLAYYRGAGRTLAGDRPAEAEQLLRAYLAAPRKSDYPSHASTLVFLGRLLERAGKRTEAAAQFRAALRLDPDRGEARDGLRRIGERE